MHIGIFPMRQRINWIHSLYGLLVAAYSINGSVAQAQTVFYHNDPAGSAIAATDESGNLLWKESYRPYGERMLKPSTTNSNWFHGKQEDADTGISDFGARNYDPVLGRFLSIDPIDFSPENIHSFNRYSYGNNNPLKYRDPDGRIAAQVVMFAIGAGIDVAAQVWVENRAWSQVNLWDAAFSGAAAAFTGTVGARFAQGVLRGTYSAAEAIGATAYVGAGAGMAVSVASDLNKGSQPTLAKVAIAGIAGAGGSAMGARISSSSSIMLEKAARSKIGGLANIAEATTSSTQFGRRAPIAAGSTAQEAQKVAGDAASAFDSKAAEQQLPPPMPERPGLF